jgi:NADPH2:quinone reductase
MRAWQVHRHAEPCDALALADVETPQPAADQVRLRVTAAACALPDVMMCRGTYAFSPTLPFTPGQEVVGEVTAVGSSVDVAIGDRVMAITKFEIGHGGFADEALASAASVYRVPDGMNDADGAGFLIAYLTGWLGLVTRGRLQPGESLAVLGAAGGTGSAAIQLGSALGAHVIAVVSSEEKARYCRALGADDTINHREEDVALRLRELTDGRGVDLVYDPVGGTPAREVVGGIANEGRLLAVGFASGESTHPSSRDVLRPNCSIVGVYTGAYGRHELDEVYGALTDLVRRRGIGGGSSTEVGFADLPEALERVARRDVSGKVVLVPSR